MATAFVQGTGAASVGSVASLVKAFTSNVTAGNTIAVGAVASIDVLGTGSVTDSLLNSYTRDVFVNGVAAGRAESAIYIAFNIAGGACTVTLDGTSDDFLSVGIAEFSGTGSSDPLDGTGTFNAASGTTLTTSSWTTASNGSTFGVMEQNGSDTTLDPGAGFTMIFESENSVGAMPIHCEYQDGILAGAGKTAVWTLGAGRSATACGCGIKEGIAASTATCHLSTTGGWVF